MSSAVGIVPDELFKPEAREQVIQFLRRLPIPVRRRKALAYGWAKEVGVKLSTEEIKALESPEVI